MQSARGRPFVRMMMAMTADGKIATAHREAAHFTSDEDRARLEEQVAWADALLLAAGTLRAYGTSYRVRRPDLAAERKAAHRPEQPLNVVVTRSLDIPIDLPFFTRQQVPRLVATTDAQRPAAEAAFAGLAEVVAFGEDRVDPSRLLDALFDRGIHRLLALGGGDLNFQLASAGLVDEIYLTLAPLLFGGSDAPTILDGAGFALHEARRLALRSCEAVGGEVFLVYGVSGRGE